MLEPTRDPDGVRTSCREVQSVDADCTALSQDRLEMRTRPRWGRILKALERTEMDRANVEGRAFHREGTLEAGLLHQSVGDPDMAVQSRR